MGLDMYLYERIEKFVHEPKEIKALPWIPEYLSTTDINTVWVAMDVELLYWRKANSIHGWFVKNVQDGNDDCGKYLTTVNDLQALHDDITEVIQNPERCDEILPMTVGFFFGAHVVDNDYLEMLERTQTQLRERILIPTAQQVLEQGYCDREFYYQASW